MKTSILFQSGAILAPFFLTLLAVDASAQDRAASPATPAFADAGTFGGVLFDEPGDGRVWALGASWKASFGADGAVYYPRVGKSEPRKLSHALSPDSVTLGGEPILFQRTAHAVRSGDRVELDRGAFTEAYDLAAETVEQSFVFETLPRAGDLVLHIPVASELETFETSAGLEFRSERGRVTYSRAVAVDARGKRTPVDTRVADGAITIVVGADVLRDAALPLVVDPILNAIFPDSNSEIETFEIDTAFDPFHGVWVVVYEQVFSATDHDVIAKMYNATGTLLATNSVDATGDLWAAPRIADLAFPHMFLVVAGVTSTTSVKTVKGRTVQPNGTIITVGPQIAISAGLTSACIRPDVGGDNFAGPQTFWCVAFEHDISTSHATTLHEIAYCLVNSAGLVVFGPATFSPGLDASDVTPSVSKSDDGNEWLLAWKRSTSTSTGDILAAHVHWDGLVLDGPFTVTGGSAVDSTPCASSAITGTRRALITFARGTTSHDIMVALIDGSTVLQVANLMTLEGSVTAATDQIEPSADSDGQHFLVSYSEKNATFGYYELFVTDLAISGDTLVPAQPHLEPQPGLGMAQRRSNVAAARTPGTLVHRYLAVYDIEHVDVAGRFVEGITGGTSNAFCFGDGTGAACPCGNSGGAGRGCANSVVPIGARLEMISGVPSTLGDTVVLQASGIPAGAPGLFFQGTNAGAGAVFGDGLRCATGSVVRLATKTAGPSGAASFPQGADPDLSVRGGVPAAGGLRTYQLWYRNSAAFCTASTFNLTNGFAIQWAP